jgi:uncharacterized membrane protein
MVHVHGPTPPIDDRTRRLLAVAIGPILVATLLGLVFLWPSGDRNRTNEIGAPDDVVDARVVAAEEVACQGTQEEAGITCIRPTVRLLEGPDAGEEIELQELSTAGGAFTPSVGDTVVLGYFADSPPGFQYSFADVERRSPLLLLTVFFAVAVVALGRWKGLRALVGIVIGLGVLIVFMLPAMLGGANPVAVALVGSAAAAIAAIYLAHGLNAASTTALIGTFASLAIVGVLAWLFVEGSQFSGLATEEALYLQISSDSTINFRGLLLAGIVIGSLGVLDDVTVTQVSAVWELRRANAAYTFRDLYLAGIRIGRDHIASTVNTLVLAYAGASLPLLLLFSESQQALVDVVNGEAIAIEVVRTLVGSIGIVASVPITTALAAAVVGGDHVKATSDPRRFRDRGERAFWDEKA